MGALAMGIGLTATTAHADTTIDSNHVRVEAGDTLSGIADKYDTRVKDLVRDNHIANKHLIHVGDKLVITPKNNKKQVVEEKDEQPVTNTPTVTPQESAHATNGSNSAKDWIAQHESGGSYTASNGRYYGKFQLDSSYLNGDYSPANQERVADQYVANRYGSWEAAQAFWMNNGWY